LVIGFEVVLSIVVPDAISKPEKCDGEITRPPLQFVETAPTAKGFILTTARRKIKDCACIVLGIVID
jgi:hypothetical protein